MRTTINLPDPLFREAKAVAAQRGMTLKALFRDALKADPRTFSLSLPERAHEAAFRRFVTGPQPSPNLWADA